MEWCAQSGVADRPKPARLNENIWQSPLDVVSHVSAALLTASIDEPRGKSVL